MAPVICVTRFPLWEQLEWTTNAIYMLHRNYNVLEFQHKCKLFFFKSVTLTQNLSVPLVGGKCKSGGSIFESKICNND